MSKTRLGMYGGPRGTNGTVYAGDSFAPKGAIVAIAKLLRRHFLKNMGRGMG